MAYAPPPRRFPPPLPRAHALLRAIEWLDADIDNEAQTSQDCQFEEATAGHQAGGVPQAAINTTRSPVWAARILVGQGLGAGALPVRRDVEEARTTARMCDVAYGRRNAEAGGEYASPRALSRHKARGPNTHDAHSQRRSRVQRSPKGLRHARLRPQARACAGSIDPPFPRFEPAAEAALENQPRGSSARSTCAITHPPRVAHGIGSASAAVPG
ncbi:hypothetical protein C8Q79DRAFT_1007922 [Trametes meyenii]|nr:hypothetical protein C8Q79DRAFT_1007922 [Trametes meyenii]